MALCFLGWRYDLSSSTTHSPCFPSRNIMKNTQTYLPPMRDVITEQPPGRINFSLIVINDQVALFNETIVNIISSFIPNETMVFDDGSCGLTILTWKNLCFTEFSTKIHWNTRLAASDVFLMFTQSIKFFQFHYRRDVWKTWFLKQTVKMNGSFFQ